MGLVDDVSLCLNLSHSHAQKVTVWSKVRSSFLIFFKILPPDIVLVFPPSPDIFHCFLKVKISVFSKNTKYLSWIHLWLLATHIPVGEGNPNTFISWASGFCALTHGKNFWF